MPIRFKPKSAENINFKPKNSSSEPSLLEKTTEEILKQAKGAISGINQLIPLSDQIVAASMTARQLINGEINAGQIGEAFESNAGSALKSKKQAIQEAPVAAGTGMGLAATVQALATGGASIPAQVGLGSLQSGSIVGGESLAEGASPMEAAVAGTRAAALSTAIGAVPQAMGAAKQGIKTLKNKYTGLSVQERLDRALGKVLRGSPSEGQRLAEGRPGIAKVASEENIFEAGLGPKKFTPISKIKKNITSKVKTRGNQIKKTMGELRSEVNAKNVAARIRIQADDLEAVAPKANKQLISRLRKTADEVADQGAITPNEAWKRRQNWDDIAFKNESIYQESQATSMKAAEARAVRDAFQNEIKQVAEKDIGKAGAETLEFLNKRFGDLKAMETVAKKGEFRPVSSLLDRLTIGAVLTASRNPAVATAFFGGREAARSIAPRMSLIRKFGEQPGTTNSALFAPAITSTLNKQ